MKNPIAIIGIKIHNIKQITKANPICLYPKKSGVHKKFKTICKTNKANGKILDFISPWRKNKKSERKIKKYKTAQTGPNNQAGGKK